MENENSVCFISKIVKIEQIENADKIELATVNGWTSVVQKGIHAEGFLVLCITTDAVIPEDLAIRWGVIDYLRKKSRVRTVKLRGAYSECILIPINDIPFNGKYHEGKDMMEVLGIVKYEPPAREVTNSIPRVYFKWNKIYSLKMWRSFINYRLNKFRNKGRLYKDNLNFNIYAKFPNQKNTPHMFNETDVVVMTRKYHGTNARFGILKKNKLSIKDRLKKFFGMADEWIDYEYVYGSHRVEKGSDSQGFYSTDVWKELAEKYQIKEKLWKFIKENFHKDTIKEGIILYAEIYGPGIQGDHYSYGLDEKKLVLFDIEINNEYLNNYFFKWCVATLELPVVEYLYEGNWSKEIQDKYVFNNLIEGTKVPHEGIVVKHISGGRRKISKVINPDYLTFSEKNNVPDSH